MRPTPRTLLYTVLAYAALAMMALIPACGDQGEQELRRSYAVGARPSVIIETFGGAVSVQRGVDGVVEVIAVLRNPQRIAFDIAEEVGVVTVRARPTGGFSFGRVTVGAAVTVIVPANTSLDITTSAGAVNIRGTSGIIRIRAAGSDVVIADVTGILDIETTMAPVRVVGFAGQASVRTTEANVAVTVASGSFQVSTTDASIHFDGSLRPGSISELRTGGAPVDVVLRRADVGLDVAAPGGTIDVRLPALAVVSRTDETLMATLGVGAAVLIVRTTDGTVTITGP